MHPLLQASIEDLYVAFERPHPDQLTGCPCCTTPWELERIAMTPLRRLGVDDLRSYASKAMTTIGDASDFRYFWPRLAELAVSLGPAEYVTDPEILLGKLAYWNWRTWPERERAATEAFLAALVLRMRDEELPPDEVDHWVCGVARALEDVTPLLERALLAETPAASANLHAFYDWNRRDLEKRGRLHGAFWRPIGADGRAGPLTEAGARVVAWLRHPHVLAAVDRAYAAAAQQEDQ